MSTAALPAPALPNFAADLSALKVVLFGMPDAGKSSLLGALVQASQFQERALRGRVLDPTNGLAVLWRRVYDERQRETLEEIVPYPIVFEPYAGDAIDLPRLDAVLFDCDGRAANELLSQRKSLNDDTRPGSLAQAVVDADALILPVDASARNEQVETDFREFVRFLRVLELQRGHERAVGGLPVYLVLTKCDLLAREPISLAEWESRIEHRREQVRERFARYLYSNAAASDVTFGSIELHVLPTRSEASPANRRAQLLHANRSAWPVSFRDCLHSAFTFHRREVSSNRRLKWTVGAAGGFIAFAAAAAIALLTTGGPIPRPVGLIDKIEQFQAHEKPLPDRLANDQLQTRKAALDEFRDNSDFERLPDDKKDYVRGRIDELQSYLRYREQLAQIPGPENVHNLPALELIKERLQTQARSPRSIAVNGTRLPRLSIAIGESANATICARPSMTICDRFSLL